MGLNITTDGVVKGFFGGNAYLAILALLFICVFSAKIRTRLCAWLPR